MPFGEQVRQFGRGDAEGHDEGQVKEQLQGRRDAMGFLRVTAGHHPQSMRVCRGFRILLSRSHYGTFSVRRALRATTMMSTSAITLMATNPLGAGHHVVRALGMTGTLSSLWPTSPLNWKRHVDSA